MNNENPQQSRPQEVPVPGEPKPDKAQRPLMLTVLCILTFVGSGMNFFSGIVIGIVHDRFILMATKIAETLDLPGMEMILQAGPVYFFTSAALYLAAIIGAIRMWRLHKSGFHIYTVAQILSVMSPMYFFHLSSPGIFDLVLSGIFVVLYGSQLKYMS